MDGSSNSEESRVGIIIVSLEGRGHLEHALCIEFLVTNNEIEYETMIMGLRITKELGVQDLKIYSDSQLIIRQVKGDYEA